MKTSDFTTHFTRRVLFRGDASAALAQPAGSLTLACFLAGLIGLGTATAQAQSSANRLTGASTADPASSGNVHQRLQAIVNRAPGGINGQRPLMVLSTAADPKVQANLEEDLAVMRHILDKVVNESLSAEPRYRKALGVDLVFAPDLGQFRNSYLEGYGAMFLLHVNFPLLPTSTKAEAPKEERDVSSSWEEARQEVFGQPSGPGTDAFPDDEPYNEENVDRLKAALIDALKNAANIRDLKPDEGVTICVFGGSKASSVRLQTPAKTGPAGGDFAALSGQFYRTPQRRTVLTIRAKKADIDAFAKGQMNADDFRKNIRPLIYETDATAGPGLFGYGTSGSGGGYGFSIQRQ